MFSITHFNTKKGTGPAALTYAGKRANRPGAFVHASIICMRPRLYADLRFTTRQVLQPGTGLEPGSALLDAFAKPALIATSLSAKFTAILSRHRYF
ncbi:hypothetical protein [Heyndrickxia coagulans]|uniref:hypothetical protein n=1 Tax=Heyndrickxia coagulans TaxID=1398 RepID=UPI00062893CA|nr:hypothetical protein [Heyndrickxia coagulans]